MYPEGEFLCIVSKQYDRGTREDQNAYVSERVKVSDVHRSSWSLFTAFRSLDSTRTWFTHVMICVSLNLENVICPIPLHVYWLVCLVFVNKALLSSSLCVRALASHATVLLLLLLLLIHNHSQYVHITR